MICGKCLFENPDGSLYCRKCGSQLSDMTDSHKSSVPVSRKTQPLTWGIIVVVGIVLIIILIVSLSSIQKANEIKESNNADRYQQWMAEEAAKPQTYDAKITDSNLEIDGDWMYISGTIKNISSRDISYYEIGVEFLDISGNVVDTDWTNGSDLSNGIAQEFEVMHEAQSNYYDYNVYVKEVS